MNPKEDELYKKIGKRIRQIREKKGKSQQTVANELNCAQTAISKIEKGETSLNVYRLVEIADYFGTSCETLCTGNDLDELDLLTKYIRLRFDECPYDDEKQEYLVLEIDHALLNYLFQMALSEQIRRLPEKARIAWQEVEKQAFHDASNGKTVSLIPFPENQIVKDNSSPNLWNQFELLQKATDNISTLFT